MNVDVTTRGSVDPEAVELAQEKLTELESAVGRPLSHVRVVLRQEKESIPNAARAEGEAQVGKTIIQGHVAADSMSHAVHELADRPAADPAAPRSGHQPQAPAGRDPDGKWDHGTWVPARPGSVIACSRRAGSHPAQVLSRPAEGVRGSGTDEGAGSWLLPLPRLGYRRRFGHLPPG